MIRLLSYLVAAATLSPVHSASGLPQYVSFYPITDLTLTLRHCNYVASACPYEDGNEDFEFKVVPAKNGDASAVTFQSVNFPDMFLQPIFTEGSANPPLGIADLSNSDDASWKAVPGLSDPTNFTIVTQSKNTTISGFVLSLSSLNNAPCHYAAPSGDIVLGKPGDGSYRTQTFVVGSPPPPPPPPPTFLTIDTSSVDHVVEQRFLGCHVDPGYTNEPLFWSSNLVYGQAFEKPPFISVYAWNDVSSSTATGAAVLDPTKNVNPTVNVPSLSLTFTSGTGIIGWSNRGIGNEGLSLQGDSEYVGYVVVLAPTATTVYLALRNRNTGDILASISVQVEASANWQQVPFSFTTNAPATCDSIAPKSDPTIDCGDFGENPGHICVKCAGEFIVGLNTVGSINVGFVYLSPGAWGTFASQPVSKSAIDTMQDMGIALIRQGGTVSQSFKWKDWIPVSQPWLRPSMTHQWGRSLVGSWGPFEFFDMCNAADITPVITLAYDTNNAEDWADLIEYLYGDNTTQWGSMRIADGHEAPYVVQTFELGNEQENPNFVQQVTAIENRRAAIGAPELRFMYPTNGGVSRAQADALSAIPGFDVSRIGPDCHVGGGGGVQCAINDFNAMPDFKQSFINCETNAAISSMERAIQESSDLQTWFNVNKSLQERLWGRAASFCSERSGHFDGFDQGISFFLPNMTWLQPPGYVHQMIKKTWQPNAYAVELSPTTSPLVASAQVSDDGLTMRIQVVNPTYDPANFTVTLTGNGFVPSSVCDLWTLSEPAEVQPIDKTLGNTPYQPTFISPVLTSAQWALGSLTNTWAVPPYSFQILVVYAK
jgi:hypothetical protein